MTPTQFKPRDPDDFIGVARSRCIELSRKFDQMQKAGGFFRGLFYGEPGIGKTELAVALCLKITGNALACELVNGQDLSPDLLRDWKRTQGGSLYSR